MGLVWGTGPVGPPRPEMGGKGVSRAGGALCRGGSVSVLTLCPPCLATNRPVDDCTDSERDSPVGALAWAAFAEVGRAHG